MANPSPTHFPLLETERTVLRALTLQDAAAVFRLRSDKPHNKYLDRPLAQSESDAVAFIQKIMQVVSEQNGYFWVIQQKGDTELSGTIGLWNFDRVEKKAELGYEMLAGFQGKGLVREALQEVLRFAFTELKLSSIEAWTHPLNERSLALLRQQGFVRDVSAEAARDGDAIEHIYVLSNPY